MNGVQKEKTMNENLTEKSSNVKKNDAPQMLNLPKTGLKPQPRPKRKKGIVLKSNTATAEPATEIPENFIVNDKGVWYKDDKWTLICSPLRVIADTCDVENKQWGRLLEFRDKKDFPHSISIPMSLLSGDGSDCRKLLMDCGLKISESNRARQLFLKYLIDSEPPKHIRCVNQLGWHDDAFVLPDATISSKENEKELLLQNVDRTANKFKPNGTLTEWQDNIARLCVGNSRLMFAVCTAFAAALLPIAEEQSGGFHLHGTSSTGKTTALLVAGSVWGGDERKGFLETWRATSNGLEAVAESHNHSLLLLDEISQIKHNPHEVGEVIYCLSNGFGKSRMNKNISARRKTEWNLLFFSSGEETLEQIMKGVGQRLFGGQEARFVNIEADANAGLGLFEELHGFNTSSELAKYLSSASKKYYGAAIREFLQKVCDNRNIVETGIEKAKQIFSSKIRFQDTSGEVYRVAGRFALVTVAGILASQFGVTNWKAEDVLACGEKIFDEWLKVRGTTGSFDTTQGVKQVLSFIAQHGASRFQSVNDSTAKIQNRAGFKRENYEGQTEYLILPEMFEGEICRGFSHIAIAKELEKLGHLRRGTENRSLKCRETLPELGRKRVYILVYEGLNDNEAEN